MLSHTSQSDVQCSESIQSAAMTHHAPNNGQIHRKTLCCGKHLAWKKRSLKVRQSTISKTGQHAILDRLSFLLSLHRFAGSYFVALGLSSPVHNFVIDVPKVSFQHEKPT